MFSSEELLHLIGKFLSTTACHRKQFHFFMYIPICKIWSVTHFEIYVYFEYKETETFIEFTGQIMLSLGYGEMLEYI